MPSAVKGERTRGRDIVNSLEWPKAADVERRKHYPVLYRFKGDRHSGDQWTLDKESLR